MLILSREVGQIVDIGDNVAMTVVEIRGDKVRLGWEAPVGVKINRREITDANKRHADLVADTSAQSGQNNDPSKGRLRRAVARVRDILTTQHGKLISAAADGPADSVDVVKAAAKAAVLGEALALINGALNITEHAA